VLLRPLPYEDPERLFLLGIEPALGRLFTPEEEAPGRPTVVVLSHGLWQRRYGGDPGVIGRSLEVDGLPLTVIGGMPERFRLLLDPGPALRGEPDRSAHLLGWTAAPLTGRTAGLGPAGRAGEPGGSGRSPAPGAGCFPPVQGVRSPRLAVPRQ